MMKIRKRALAAGIVLAASSLAFAQAALAENPTVRFGEVTIADGTVLRTVILTQTSLPVKGPFQVLEMDEGGNLSTEFGPGDVGYVGGRWVLQTEQGPVYFMCPLLGGGPMES